MPACAQLPAEGSDDEQVVVHVVGARPVTPRRAVHAALAEVASSTSTLSTWASMTMCSSTTCSSPSCRRPSRTRTLRSCSAPTPSRPRGPAGLRDLLRNQAGKRGGAGANVNSRCCWGAAAGEAEQPGPRPPGGPGELRPGDARGAYWKDDVLLQPSVSALGGCVRNLADRRHRRRACRADDTMIDSPNLYWPSRCLLGRARPRARPLRARHAPPPGVVRQPRAARPAPRGAEQVLRVFPVAFLMDPRTKARIGRPASRFPACTSRPPAPNTIFLCSSRLRRSRPIPGAFRRKITARACRCFTSNTERPVTVT